MEQQNPFFFPGNLEKIDPLIDSAVKAEEERQQRKLVLIASESICPKPVREATANIFSNIYAEGYPSLRMYEEERGKLQEYPRQLSLFRRYQDRRFYKGTDFANFIEAIAIRRAQELFATDKYPNHPNPTSPEEIFVNVQPLSGAAANNAVYNAFVEPGDTVMGLYLPHGGHLTHGSEFNRSGKTFKIVPYYVDSKTGHLNYDDILATARECKPKMLIAGASAYPWEMDFLRLREICDEVGAILLADIAHPAGLMSAGYLMSPIGLADVITTTTHKTLCGPRGAIIMSTNAEIAKKVDMGVFPGEQGGPHINQIAGKAVSFMINNSDSYRKLMGLVIENCKALGDALKENGLTLAYGGSENHLLLVDLRKIKSPGGYPLTGEMASRILDLIGITCNKNTIAGDSDAAQPGGIRIGTTWITQRGMLPEHMPKLAEIIAKTVKNIHTFRYIESKGYAGRGKIDFNLYQELKNDLSNLIDTVDNEVDITNPSGYPFFHRLKKASAVENVSNNEVQVRGKNLVVHYGDKDAEISNASEGAALVETPHFGIIKVHGDRARAGLQEILTFDILALQPWQTARSFILDPDGNIIDDVDILRTDSDGDSENYYIITHGENHEYVKTWLRELSDCYVITDKEEFFAKVEGPYIVDDLSSKNRANFRSFMMFGDRSLDVLKKFDPKWQALKPYSAVMNSEGIFAIYAPFHSEVRIVVFGEETKLQALEEKLLASGALKGGIGVISSLRESKSLPVYSADKTYVGKDFVESHPEMFCLTKCSYVGWRSLPQPAADPNQTKFTWEEIDHEPYKSCLYDEHLKLGGKMVPFAGWTMPVTYKGLGNEAEHTACREGGALFDVTHMGVLDFCGENVIRFLDQVTSNYAHWLRDGQGHYSYLLGPDGVPIDDILLYRISKTHYLMVVNAANADKDEEWLRGVNSGKYIIDEKYPFKRLEAKVTIRNLKNEEEAGSDSRVDIALQGPSALDALLTLAEGLEFKKEIYRLKRFCFARGNMSGCDVIVARTGYTGENIGYEIYVHPKKASIIWQQILEVGEPLGIKPAGLGARDSLRTEAGLPLYGHELAGSLNVSPIEAGYGFAVRFHKPFFIGRDAALENEKSRKKEIIRFRATSKATRMLTTGDPILDKNGKVIGNVSSSVVVSGYQIALGYVLSRAAKEGARIFAYPLTALRGKDKAIKQLTTGDKSIIPVECDILSRFPEPVENSYPVIVNWSKY